MAPKSCQESEDEQVSPAPAGVKPDSSDLESPVGTPMDTVAPSRSQSSKPYCASIPVGCSFKQQLAPETLDPRTLRLLWEQRELEIQALRWAVQNSQNARYYHILQEVAGIPPERHSKSQDKFLQNQVQKLTLELKAQKEHAQLEKEQLEEKLRQNLRTMQQMEAELQTFEKSCLLQLARSSWVGRVIRSQTGSVEVVTAEVLRDPTDSSDYVEVPSGTEGFRLEDVDWNSVAQRYPNLFSNMSFHSEQKLLQPHPSYDMDTWDSECAIKSMEKPGKILEWSALPLVDSSSSGGTDSDSNSYQIVRHSGTKKVSGHPAQGTDLAASEQIQECTRSFSGHMEDPHKSGSASFSKTVLESCTDLHHQYARPQLNLLGCSLKIAAVSHREKFIRILNQSQAETVDLGGFVLKQLVRDFPVCMYRFPPGTLLAPQHHITVWGEGTSRTKKQLPVSSGQDPLYFQSSRGCVTVLVNPQGQVLSEHQAAPCMTLGSKIFKDNTDWSIDRFPLSESEPNADPGEEQRRPPSPHKGRVRGAGAGRKKLGPGIRQQRLSRTSTNGQRTSGSLRPNETRDILPLLSIRKLLYPGEVPAQQEGVKTETSELLPAIPECASRMCLEDSLGRQERKVQVCRKSVDLSCPMVALSVQSTAESRYGFRFLCYPPITEDLSRRL
ncbi:lamin tail domain-containing protein 2 isoform X1 [Peromyscus eremicus]|uniref:lamin tail domain-containing protein 2 isoform X1 n=1 Tax=Peromyscus eremicus TaxID=42410 RepID=UPI0027DE7573|nr:lamin tail domain-containing protein 2 isoform X1 [Peromyscus eremicus]XP_059120621.1 lamin tail domain-containing protein 2 isoform X1 [Peromyscus eremicus]XP_059120622.1 lamin tail domain-containing protein 2 isoform X1 [Peromyscus eremicus]